ncbi:hypothetical protein BJ878DRAFT_508001 [Calycina marina]|uniref:PARP-type domain-containing protein n=1 Tax=Calycina marina TaxID=1763456 RepID=A0A9P7Z1U9_9HELO|nr:hypothetical protein BJ878DRAFT_508001 [Calycina marina]
MSYRVELAKTGRAVCKNTECKKHQIKIDKGTLRFGVWVDLFEHGSWSWKHWGCTTGKQLQNIREYLLTAGEDYDFDMLDGYDDDEGGGLKNYPELREKVRRVITQGFIDPEEWKGDPDMNKLGETGTLNLASRKRIREEEKSAKLAATGGAPSEDGGSPATQTPKTSGKKRVNTVSDIEEDAKPAKKKRAGKVNKEESDEEDEKPAKKKPARKIKKEEPIVKDEPMPNAVDFPEKNKPVSRANKVKAEVKEEDDIIDVPEKPTPAKKSRAKKVKGELKEENTEDKPVPVKIARGKEIKAVEVKDEPVEDELTNNGEEQPKLPTKKPRSNNAPKNIKTEAEDEAADGSYESETALQPKKLKKRKSKRTKFSVL